MVGDRYVLRSCLRPDLIDKTSIMVVPLTANAEETKKEGIGAYDIRLVVGIVVDPSDGSQVCTSPVCVCSLSER